MQPVPVRPERGMLNKKPEHLRCAAPKSEPRWGQPRVGAAHLQDSGGGRRLARLARLWREGETARRFAQGGLGETAGASDGWPPWALARELLSVRPMTIAVVRQTLATRRAR